MFIKKQFQSIALITLFVFISFTLTYEYSFGQNESPLIKAQDLYYKGDFIEAIKVLDAFIIKIKNNQAENKRLAEAYYLLARINYDSGEDGRTEDFLKLALAANNQIGQRETDLTFKARLDQVKKEWLKTQSVENKIMPEAPSETIKADSTHPEIREKEKPIPQLKKPKKFPWLLSALGVGAIALLIVYLIKKNKPEPSLDINFYLSGSIFPYYNNHFPFYQTNIAFKIYIDGTYVTECSTKTYGAIDITFLKSLKKGTHKFSIIISSATEKLDPILQLLLIEDFTHPNELHVIPEGPINIFQGNGFVGYLEVNDSIEIPFEVKSIYK